MPTIKLVFYPDRKNPCLLCGNMRKEDCKSKCWDYLHWKYETKNILLENDDKNLLREAAVDYIKKELKE